MRMWHILALALLALPLGGCFGVTLPAGPIPDWAMNPQAQEQEQVQERAAPAARRTPRAVSRRAPGELTAAQSALLTGGTGASAPRAPEGKPFAPGWDALEEQRDESLRRTMSICRGC
jgi:hypothetical protein